MGILEDPTEYLVVGTAFARGAWPFLQSPTWCWYSGVPSHPVDVGQDSADCVFLVRLQYPVQLFLANFVLLDEGKSFHGVACTMQSSDC